MLFNSLEFLLFFPIVCIIYYLLGRTTYRNFFLLAASYYFYMNWVPSYALLILFSTVLTYFCGLLMEKNADKPSARKKFLLCSLSLNFLILFLFKYYNFLNETVWSAMQILGLRWNVPNLDILLPVGISFYTFQAVGYTVDVYRGDIRAERNFITYALFVSFFPQLVAGPIERAKNLLPQFHQEHRFSYEDLTEGFRQMVWGFFMKLCVADRIGEYVDAVYGNVAQHNGTSLLLATFLFAFQIYCDFGGYSHIAVGTARIMGFRLMENFRRPYLSFSVREFWKRWHISLSTWFRDYVYIPLGGNRVKYIRHLSNLMITFLVSGIWHGAYWTFVLWGGLHGIYLIIDSLVRRYVQWNTGTSLLSRILQTISCFVLVDFAWIFFRADCIQDAFLIIKKIFTEPGPLFSDIYLFSYIGLSLVLLIFKDMKEEWGWNLHFLHSRYLSVRYVSLVVFISFILQTAAFGGGQFIYFQF